MRPLLTAILLLTLWVPQAFADGRRTPVVEAVEKVGSAVVNIRTEQVVQRRYSPFFGFGDSLIEEFFGSLSPQQVYRTQSLGSGVIINADGLVLTNNHVIERASRILVALPGRDGELEATLVGSDPLLDVALVRLPEGVYPSVRPGRSDDLLLGETVIAIGNPLGLGHSVTTGIVSARERILEVSEDAYGRFIQTDALINPGNSGGPLLNIEGDLIGVNTAIIKQAQGIGFAIPINIVNRLIPELLKHGEVRPPYSGIVPAAVSSRFVREQGRGGVLVSDVLPGAPAAKAGVERDDLILSLDGSPVESLPQFLSFAQSYVPGSLQKIGLLRGGRPVDLVVRLDEIPEGLGNGFCERVMGFTLRERNGALQIRQVVSRSPADQAGIRPGDLLTKVGEISPGSLEDLDRIIGTHLHDGVWQLTVVRGNRAYRLELP